MENYEYNVVEKSITQDFMIKWVWMPSVKAMPKGTTPNMLTYIGLIFVVAMVAGTWYAGKGHFWGLLVAAASTFLYMLCDNTDGLLARSTGQTSKLGEFLDHWLDSFSFVLVDACIACSLGMKGMWFFAFVAMLALAFYITMWEHHYTGIFYSGHIGSNERMFVYIILYVCAFVFPGSSWLTFDSNSFSNIPMILFILVALGSTFTTLGCLMRVKKHLFDFVLYTASLVAIGLWCFYGFLHIHWVVGLFIGVNMIFCGKLVKEHLTKTQSPYRYKLAMLILPVCFALPFVSALQAFSLYIASVSLGMMGLTALWDGISTIRSLGKA